MQIRAEKRNFNANSRAHWLQHCSMRSASSKVIDSEILSYRIVALSDHNITLLHMYMCFIWDPMSTIFLFIIVYHSSSLLPLWMQFYAKKYVRNFNIGNHYYKCRNKTFNFNIDDNDKYAWSEECFSFSKSKYFAPTHKFRFNVRKNAALIINQFS